MRRGRRALIVFTAMAVTATVAVAGLRLATSAPGRIPWGSVPEGVSARDVDGRPVFLVRAGDFVVGFSRISPRNDGARLLWCRDDDVFQAPATGESFDRTGRLVRGPASPRNMDRIRVAVHDDGVTVDPSAVTRGDSNLDAAGQVHFDPHPLAEWRADHPTRDAPSDYCSPTTP